MRSSSWRRIWYMFACAVIAFPAAIAAAADNTAQNNAATTAFWDGQHMARLRASHPENDPRYKEVLARLKKNAEISVKRGPYSVVDKKQTPPSGDKHDYLSIARYWWPNPDTPDGLPYVRRDGRTNEDALEQGDRVRIGDFFD